MPVETLAWINGKPVLQPDTPAHRRTCLDPHESTVEPAPQPGDALAGQALTLPETFRHSGWHSHRKLVYDALRYTRQSITRIHRFANCGCDAWILRSVSQPGQFRMATNACRDRLCMPCQRERGNLIRHNVLKHLHGQPARFVTLTLRGPITSLDEGISRLLTCFRRLRQRRFWQRKVKGGVAFVEFKYSPKSNGWHPHLHIICHGKYIPKGDLQAAWYAVTGDSFIVDLSYVGDENRVANYVTKYCTKPYDRDTVRRPNLLQEIIAATARRKLVFAFGDWKDLVTLRSPDDGEWETFGDLDTVIAWANNGDPDALEALDQCLGRRAPSLMSLWWQERPHARGQPHAIYEQLTFALTPDASRF